MILVRISPLHFKILMDVGEATFISQLMTLKDAREAGAKIANETRGFPLNVAREAAKNWKASEDLFDCIQSYLSNT